MIATHENVIVTDTMCACHAVHTIHVHHRDFPEVHVEGLTPGDAAEHLIHRLTSVLDSTASQVHRERVEGAIADVREFVELNPPTGLREATTEPTPTPQEAPRTFDVRPLGAALVEARSAPLVKTDTLEVVRLVVRRDKEIPTHPAPGEATVLCLEGKVDFHVGGTTHRLIPGQLLHLHAGEPHALVALEDSSLLLTFARR